MRIKDFVNAAMFSVTNLGIDLGFEYLRSKSTGANATYSLSAKVQNTDWMDFDATQASNQTRRTLEKPKTVVEEDEETDPIYLDLWATDYDSLYDGVLVLNAHSASKVE